MIQSELLDPAWRWLLAAVIALARPTAMMAVTPVLTRGNLTGLLRGAVAAVLAFPAIPHLAGQVTLEGQGSLALLLLTAKEAVIGALLGLMLGLPFWAFEVAGDLLDLQRGATAGRLNDPAGFDDVSITGTLLVVTGITLFVATGGLLTLASLLYASWAIWAPLAAMPLPTAQAPLLLLGFLDALLRQGLLLAVPVIVAMLLADLALVLVGRFAPQLRIEDMASAARNLVFYVFMPAYCAFLLSYLQADTLALPGLLDRLRPGLQ